MSTGNDRLLDQSGLDAFACELGFLDLSRGFTFLG